MSYDLLSFICFALLGVLLIGYAILDGFDLGVGMLHPFIAKSDHERRLVMNSIGPLWDGNEVWLVTFGGALFAAFPNAYASVLSSFYTLFYCVLTCLIGRAVSLEFRSKVKSNWWRAIWDRFFFLSSAMLSFLLGVAAGNIMKGMSLGPDYHYEGNFAEQLGWYPILVGLLTMSLFSLHGAIFLYLKTEGELQERTRQAINKLFLLFAGMYLTVTIATLFTVEHATENIRNYPALWIVPVLNCLAVLNIPRAMHLKRPGYAFFTSAMVITALATLFSVAIYPNFIMSTIDPAFDATVTNSRSSEATLKLILIIAAVGMPFVASYTFIIYRIFSGKVRLDPNSY